MPPPNETSDAPAGGANHLALDQPVELKDYRKEKYGIEPAAGGVVMATGPATDKPAQDIRSATFRADLLAHFRAARDKAISNLAHPEG